MNINVFKTTILMCLLIGITGMKKNEGKPIMSILQDKPVFELKLEGFGSQYVIYINGVSAHKQYNSGGQINTKLPINHWMRSGKNNISIITWPDYDDAPISPHARINIQLVVSNHNVPEKVFSVASINFQNKLKSPASDSSSSGKYNSIKNFESDELGDIEVLDVVKKERNDLTQGAIEFSRNINIPSSIPLWSFFNSDELPDYNGMSDEDYYKDLDILLIEYLKVQSALSNKKTNEILPFFSERNKELDLAFYNPPGTLEKQIKDALMEAANNPEAELVSLSKDYVGFSLRENKKLVSLTRNEEKAAIVFNYKNGMGSFRFDLIFRMKDGKWILTR